MYCILVLYQVCIYKCFLFGTCLHFLNAFWRRAFNFDTVQFINFFFNGSCFWYCIWGLCPTQGHKDFFLIFLPKISLILGFTFQFYDACQVNFGLGCENGSKLLKIFFDTWISYCFQHHLLKRQTLCNFGKNQLIKCVWVYFWTLLFHWSMCLSFYQYTWCWWLELS